MMLPKGIIATILQKCEAISEQQLAWRRHLHKHPELSGCEYDTTAWLRERVAGIGLTQLPIDMQTGLLVQLGRKKTDHTIAIRTDLDALPIHEQIDLPFRSCIDGRMHACGHDVHMAVVLGAAAVLYQIRDTLPGNVRFIFQPSEEQPPGGARPMIENGALDGVNAILGLHVDPRVGTGRIGLRDGVTMASVTDFDLTIMGRSGHAARPQQAVDAIATAAEVIDSIQKIVSREIDPISPVVITFGRISGGTARNVISDKVVLNGTARALSPIAAKKLPQLIKRTAQGVCRARGATMKMELIAGYPVLCNDAGINNVLRRNVQALFGRGKAVQTEPILGGEDFACYLQQVPGAMFRLGILNKTIGADKSWHSPEFMVDERAMPIGTALLVASTIDLLGGQNT